MRLRMYALTAVFCAAAGAALAQAPGNGGVAVQQTPEVSTQRALSGPQGALQPSPQKAIDSATAAQTGPNTPDGAEQATATESQAANPNLHAILQQHPVITTDDMREMRFNSAEVFIPTEFTDQPVVNPAFCDAGCEAEARAAAGMDHAPDSEWGAQFAAARMDLAGDKEWGAAYADGMQRLHSYCVFQDQARKAFPRGRDQASQDQRAQWAQYVGDMNRSLGGGVDSSAVRIRQAIQQAQARDSVRAAIMEVLAERAFSQCTTALR